MERKSKQEIIKRDALKKLSLQEQGKVTKSITCQEREKNGVKFALDSFLMRDNPIFPLSLQKHGGQARRSPFYILDY